MNFYSFAFRNLMRNKWRTLLTILACFVVISTLILVLALDKGYRAAVEEELVKNTGVHLYISREGCPMDAASIIAQGGISPLYVPEAAVRKVESIPGIKEIMPFKIYALTTPDGTRTDIFFGTTEAIQRIRPNWKLKEGSWFTDENSVILGSEIARLEKRAVGDKIYFEQLDKEFTVAGVLFPTYTQDDGIVFLPLTTAQKLIDREGKLSAIALQLEDITRLEEVRTAIQGNLPEDYFVIPPEVLSKGVMGFFGSTKAIMLAMVIIAFIITAVSIMNTMLMAAMERRREFAYLKCVGAGSGDIIKLMLYETMIICALGALLAILPSILFASTFEGFIRRFLVVFIPKAPIVRVDFLSVIFTLVIVFAIGILAALYPAVKSARAVPMEAIRNE